MDFTITKIERKPYRPLFASADINLLVATVEVEGHSLGFSHRDDDPDGVWGADSHFGPDGYPHFSHGEGDRTVAKQTASGDLADALNAAAAEL